MRHLLAIVYFFTLSIHCRSVTVSDDTPYEPSPKRYVYSETELAAPEALPQDRQVQYYKAARRSGRVPPPAFQYVPEDALPETDYAYAAPASTIESIPQAARDYEVTKRLGIASKRQPVEQYLKEVTPTTKTAYNRRAGNYLRSNGQAHVRSNKQQTQESQRSILKQSPYQYVLQSELPQKPQVQPQIQPQIQQHLQAQLQPQIQPHLQVQLQPQIQPHLQAQLPSQIQYDIPEQKSQQVSEQQPQPAGLSRYQTALLAHQKVLLESDNQDETSRSSIYVTHTIPKKPTRKLVKPKQSAVDEDVEYYTRLQQYQQQLQQKQPQFYEQQQPAQVMYQSKLPYPKEDSTEETVTYQQQKPVQYQQPRQYQQQILQFQPPTPTRQAKKSRRPVKYQQEYQTAQEGAEPSYEYQTAAKPEEAAAVEHQQPTPLRQGPKYLPEPKPAQYQPGLEETDLKYRQVAVQAPQQPLISYEAAIAKLQAEQLGRSRVQGLRQQARYQEQEVVQPAKYQLQYPEENQQAANQEDAEADYIKPEQPIRLRPAGRGVAYRQPLQQPNVRYYRNLARPLQYSSYE